jgi:serine/threonine protein kinase/Leucine-rich repeat (LRR) protein
MFLATCPSPADLERLFLGGLPEQEVEALEEHVLGCGSCLETLRRLLHSKETLAGVLGKETRTDPPGSHCVVDDLVKKLESLRSLSASSPQTQTVSQNDTANPQAQPPPCRPDDADRTQTPDTGHESSVTNFLTPPQADDELGRLGKYRVLQILGHGGMGVVFKAEDPLLRRTVAVKVMLPALAASASAGQRFLREAQAMAAIEHDHIVRIYQVEEQRGVPFLAMELLKGEPLADRLNRESKLPLADVLRIGREIAEGLGAAHATGLIHRDIKPGNIWLEDRSHKRPACELSQPEPTSEPLVATASRVKILDFGLARAGAQPPGLSQPGAVVGTPEFMAPEQGRGGPVDARSDLFSLGVVLYRLATGQQPFHGADTVSTLLSVATHEPAPPLAIDPDLPPELSDLVMKLLEKDPTRRVASAGTVVQALQTLEKKLAGVPGNANLRLAFPAGLVRAASAAPRSRRRFALAIAALLLLGVLVGAGVWGLIHTQMAVQPTSVDDAWLKAVAALPAEKQVEAVAAKLKERNPGFDGKVTPTIDQGVVTELTFVTDAVTDIAPVRALTALRTLSCSGSAPGMGQLADLSPLKGMELVYLNCGRTKVSDLAPVKDMKLTTLLCDSTKVTDLAPLKDLPLTRLEFFDTQVADLLPLKDMRLSILNCGATKVSDLAPLKNMELTRLLCANSKVTDLAPLKGMRLAYLNCAHTQVTELSPLKDIPLTQLEISATPVSDLSPLKNMKLTILLCYSTKVTDLSPLKDMKLTDLRCNGTKVTDLSPLKDMMLVHLDCSDTKVSDLSPLKDMKLTSLYCSGTPVSDLSPLKDNMRLSILQCAATKVSDLSPLKDMKLHTLFCNGTQVSDLSPLKDMGLTNLVFAYTQVSDLSPLKDMKLGAMDCARTQVSDLAPLKDMKLTSLNCNSTKVTDLSPLKDMKLTHLQCIGTKVTDLSPVRMMPLQALFCDFEPARDAEILRSIKTLQKINNMPALEFWKDVDKKKP